MTAFNWTDIPEGTIIKSITDVIWLDNLNKFNDTDYYILGSGQLSQYLHDLFYEKTDNFNILYYPPDKKFYMQLHDSTFVHWHQFNDSKELIEKLPHLIEIYNPKEHIIDFDSQSNAVIATKESIDEIREIEDEMFYNKYTEVFFWGSKWKDFPFDRSKVKNYGHLLELEAKHASHQFNDKYYSTSFRTLYSKSIIEFIDYNELYYLVQIKYPSTKMEDEHIREINKTLERYYPLDFPIDIVLALRSYVYCPEDLIKSQNNDKDDCIKDEDSK